MLNPAIGKLIESYENRYGLVTEIANCAREISAEAEEGKEILLEKPVSIAINKIAAEKNLI
ncbi:MAG: DNA-directed RNA polymerase subunit omega [Clostridia bacterium]|nr:DNA-directed RNA polymerase subunit omega [Clostridia bacterium]